MRPQVSWRALTLGVAGLLLCTVSSTSSAEKIERPTYRTAYACEGNLLHITCEENHIINLIRANYGRFSITVCNQHGMSDWSVNCMSTRSFRVLQEKCSQQNSCSIQASTQVFGDPCPGTWKYLEAHYQCVAAFTTTSATTTWVRPPWMPTAPSDWLVPTVTQSPTTVTTASTTTTVTTPTTSTTPATTTTASPEIVTTTESAPTSTEMLGVPTQEEISTVTAVSSTTTASTVTTEIHDVLLDYCAPMRVRDLQWNWTKKGEIAAVPCPGGASGYAKWRCGINPVQWTPETPDLSGCKSAWVTDITDRIDHGDQSVVRLAAELAQLTQTKPLYGGDTIAATALLKNMASKMADKLRSMPAINKEEFIKELMQSVIETSSNLLDPQQRVSWHDLSRREQMRAATSLLVGLEENAYLLADQVNYEKVLVDADRNVMMSVKVYEVQNVKEVHFPTNEDLNNVAWELAADSISLPAEALLDRAEHGLVKVVFFTFSNLEQLLQPTQEDTWAAGEDEPIRQNSTHILNTRVISASLGRGSRKLRQPAVITLRHIREDNVSNPICAFWDYKSNSWSAEGCKVVVSNRTHTVCSCNHLTNFAVLMDVQGVKITSGHEIALKMITYIGCIISIVCLALSFLTFVLFRGLKNDRNTIHKNLCACLLIAEVVFLAGISQTEWPVVCGVVAGLLHFFFLCAFAWMFLEGFQLYVMLIEVFESEKSRVRWYYAMAYGIPALVVGISCIVDPFSYGTEHYCWLRTDNYFIFSFVGPVIAILLANFVFLGIAIYMMCKHANASAAVKSKEQTKVANIRAWIKGAMILVFLLGLTWAFGLLYLNQETLVMAYIFTVLNSLQGVFIFIFHCVQNDKVQKEYKKLLRRSQCLSSCMKESVKERRSSFYINSNGTASIPNSNSSSTVQQSNFNHLWGSQNGKAGSGRSSISKIGTPPGNQPGLHPELEVEKASYKSSNRDSGHGGSDHEDSLATTNSGSVRYNRSATLDYGGLTSDLSTVDSSKVDSDFLNEYCQDKLTIGHDLQQQQQQKQKQDQSLQNNQLQSKNVAGPNNQQLAARLHHPRRHLAHPVRMSPLNHIYMDIDGEPVYEEIPHRHEAQVSDLSDDGDGRRRSDISRQSSGSYGDNRPLIPQLHTSNPSHSHMDRLQHHTHNGSVPPHHQHHHLHYHHQPRTTTRGRPPPPPEPIPGQDHHLDRLDPAHAPYLPDMKGGHTMPLFPPVPAPPYGCQVDPSRHQQLHPPRSLADLHDAAIPPSGVPQDLHHPSDALFVAMLDGRKVVSRLQPQSRAKDPQLAYKTNSFSEC